MVVTSKLRIFTLVLSFSLFILFFSFWSLVRLHTYTDTPSRAMVIPNDLARTLASFGTTVFHSYFRYVSDLEPHTSTGLPVTFMYTYNFKSHARSFMLPLELCSPGTLEGIEPLTHQRGALGS